MSDIPTTALEYRLTEPKDFQSLTLVEGPVPVPGPSEVLVKIHAVSLNLRDLVITRGGNPLPLKENVIPCSDMSGVVVSLGSNAKLFHLGDRVSANFAINHISGDPTPETKQSCLCGEIDGVLAEYRVFPEHALVHVPEHLSYEEASTLPCAGVTAYNALTGSIPIKPGDFVLVQGTGGVALFSIQFASALGATVIVISSSNAKLAIAEELGAKYLINYSTTPDWQERVLEVTNGRGTDHIIELGGTGTWIKSMQCVRYCGHIHVIGATAPPGDISAMPMYMIQKTINMHAIQVGPRTLFEEMNALITKAKIHPRIDKTFTLEDSEKAYEYLAAQGHVGKVVIKVAKE